jgi:F-type H+-transporting ATPase subunit epsilon
MASAGRLQFVLVTPEKTLIDEPVLSIQFPLFDGQIGILPSRAPMVGRLGCGVLSFTTAEGDKKSYFIDSGFVQVKGAVVSLLTNRAFLPDEIDASEAKSKLEEANTRVAKTEEEALSKLKDQESARKMIHMSKN